MGSSTTKPRAFRAQQNATLSKISCFSAQFREPLSKPWHQTLHTAFLSQLLPSLQVGQPCVHTSHTEQARCAAKQKLFTKTKIIRTQHQYKEGIIHRHIACTQSMSEYLLM